MIRTTLTLVRGSPKEECLSLTSERKQMPLKSLVLHFGAHKTGTSLIQKYLRDKEELCAKAGIVAMPRGDGDRFIRWGGAKDLEAGAQGLKDSIAKAEADSARYFVLSHENCLGKPFRQDAAHIYPHVARNCANLKKAIGDRPVRVVYYIRSQAAFLESYFLQTIHEGASHQFDKYLKDLGTQGFSWAPLYEALCTQFGAQNVVLRSFDQDIAAGQAAFLQRFMESATAADLSVFKGFAYGPVRNPSVGTRGLELASGINPLLRNATERKLFRKFLQDNFSNRDYPRPTLLSAEAKEEMRLRYETENAGLIAAAAAAARAPD